MTETSRFWQSTSPGDAGAYSSDQFAQYTRYLLGDSANADSGPITGSGVAPDPGLTVQQRGAGANMSVDVTVGAAFVNGTFYYTDATVNLVVTSNASGNPRIDTVILRKDWSAQTVRLVVKPGTPAATPVPPGLTQSAGTTWEIPLYDIAVANGAITITTANCTAHNNPANVSDGIYLQGILNNSGVVLKTGDTMKWDFAGRSVIKTAAAADSVAGVWVGQTAIGGYGRMLIKGIGFVHVNAATTVANPLIASSTVGQATLIVSLSLRKTFAITLEGIGAAGNIRSLIDCIPQLGNFGIFQPLGSTQYVKESNADYTIVAGGAFADLDATNHILTLTCQGRVRVMFAFSVGNAAGATGDFEADIILDSTTRAATLGGGAGTNGLARITLQSGATVLLQHMIVDFTFGTGVGTNAALATGSHTFKLQVRSITNNFTVKYNAFPIRAEAIEV